MPEMLGKLPPRIDPRTLRMAKYLLPDQPPPPDKRLWQLPVPAWPVGGNDRYGNCVIVCAANMILSWRANELADTRPIRDSAIIELSRDMRALNGYVVLDRLRYWKRAGMWSNTLHAYAAGNPEDGEEVRRIINSFGAIDVGLRMPRGWQSQAVWGTGHGPAWRAGSWGGHSVPILGYDPECLYCVTWGRIQPITWPAMCEYCDEAYALINPDWYAGDGTSPSGYDLDALEADLRALA